MEIDPENVNQMDDYRWIVNQINVSLIKSLIKRHIVNPINDSLIKFVDQMENDDRNINQMNDSVK